MTYTNTFPAESLDSNHSKQSITDIKKKEPNSKLDSLSDDKATNSSTTSRTSVIKKVKVKPRIKVFCESLAYLKSGKILKWTTKFCRLRDTKLNVCSKSSNTSIIEYDIKHGNIWNEKENGIAFTDINGKQLFMYMSDRGDFIRWINAINLLSLHFWDNYVYSKQSIPSPHSTQTVSPNTNNQENSNSPHTQNKKVSFNGSVRVRKIPLLSYDEISVLFYTPEEMDKFCADSTPLAKRTGRAVKQVYKWLSSSNSNQQSNDT